MKKLIIIPIVFLLVSCANIKDTVVPKADGSLSTGLNGRVIYSEGCKYDGAELKVSHYQGILRLPAPAFFGGFPQAERDKMLKLSVQTAAFAFFNQLQEMGADVRLLEDGIVPENGSILLQCSITKVKIGIYDDGWSGYGSAGDFWEAETDFSLKALKNGKEYAFTPVIGKGQIKHAPISPGTFMDAVILSAKMATAAINGSMFGVVKEGFIDYKIDKDAKTPVDPAARLAAVEASKQIAQIE